MIALYPFFLSSLTISECASFARMSGKNALVPTIIPKVRLFFIVISLQESCS
jgi:hypothetical protein